MSWGGLNNALTAWRNAVMRRFPDKDTTSDGARADAVHRVTSEHQPDADGTVDAYDMDVNVLAGTPESGTATERRLVEAMKLDFQRDPHSRGKLWIHQREIANRDIGNWRRREYTGESPHDKHVHWQSIQSREDDGSDWPMPHTDALLRELRGDDVSAEEVVQGIETKRPYTLARISERGWGNLSLAAKVDYIFESLVASQPADVDGDDKIDSTSVQARLARIEDALARLEANARDAGIV